jgi:biopolymer transport protein ExbD
MVMAEKTKPYDVWIVETSTVYSQVPYAVVTDWAQQGRLLEDDKVRASGTTGWLRMADVPAFNVFLPRAEPHHVEDKAEALEPVHVDFAWKPRPTEEDDDVDMIPLIDISLVLLIFFMMTAAVGSASSLFATPRAEYLLLNSEPEMWWIGIHHNGDPPTAKYSLGKGDADRGVEFPSREDMIRTLAEDLKGQSRPIEIRVRADWNVPCEVITRELAVDLERLKKQRKLANFFIEVSQKEGP